jgi:phosphohistidine phosphatase SixA
MAHPVSRAGGSRRRFVLGAFALAVAPAAPGEDARLRRGADDATLWAQLRRGGVVMLIRHTNTESAGDQPGYTLDDCSKQRNLSERGREEAVLIGERMRLEKVPIERVYTSPWCRCRETARLAFGAAEDWEPLASSFDVPHREEIYAERVRKRIGTYSTHKPRGNIVMVTHNLNIAAITKLSVMPGGVVVVRPDGCCGVRTLGQLVLV